ncbi:MAG: hypothetical protein V8R81_08655 [Clostridia bacterium]|jgi:hypothetical protein
MCKYCEKNISIKVKEPLGIGIHYPNKDKIIDLMAEFIEDELTVDEFCTKEGCYADNYIDGHCEKCLNCIKQYFENKAKEAE